MAASKHHDKLWKICKKLVDDYEPYGKAERNGADCSCGCEFYYNLEGRGSERINLDWGVCCNPKSHRCGILTFEHQGCPHFKQAKD